MHLADHISPLLRDHDCVIIPDFGGLVAEPVPAHFTAARQHLAPPAKQVAFNQSLTRNDGLLVDALSQHLGIPAAQAREVLRRAVADMHQQLRQQQRTELPGIGVFRQAPGRGLLFDYTGTDNLLPAAFGLPALSVRPVLATDARLAREKRPALLQAAPRRRAGTAAAAPAAVPARQPVRLLRRVGVGVIASLVVSASYLLGMNAGLLPAAWHPYSAAEQGVGNAARPAGEATPAPTPPPAPEPQQATLAHNGWRSDAAAPTPEELPAAAASAAEAPFRAAGTGLPASDRAPASKPAKAATATAGAPGALGAGSPAAKAARPLPAASPARPASVRALVAGLSRNKGAASPGKLARKPALAGRRAAPPAARSRVALTPAPAASPATATTINRRLGRSYVVAGAFDTQAGAEACRRNLARGGFAQAKVLLPNRTTRRFRATVADYADPASARAAAAQLRFQRKIFFDVYSY